MIDPIDRQAAIDVLHGYFDGMLETDTVCPADIYGLFKCIPSAQPEIIRCKDCRHYEWTSNRVPEEQTWYCYNWNAETGKDDYCSFAERRQE